MSNVVFLFFRSDVWFVRYRPLTLSLSTGGEVGTGPKADFQVAQFYYARYGRRIFEIFFHIYVKDYAVSAQHLNFSISFQFWVKTALFRYFFIRAISSYVVLEPGFQTNGATKTAKLCTIRRAIEAASNYPLDVFATPLPPHVNSPENVFDA